MKSPSERFWTDDLEIHIRHVQQELSSDILDEWVNKRTGRQLGVLAAAFGLRGMTKRKEKEAIRALDGELLPYLLVDRFAQFKSKVAVLDFARATLPTRVVESCMKGIDDPDKPALLFAIYHHRWTDLRLVFHLDKVHKTGFARMRLARSAPKVDQPLKDFLTEEKARSVLATFDKARHDGLTSEVKSVIPQADRVLVFIRRGERPDHLVAPDGSVMHGYKSEWIILDFAGDARRVDISSVSVDLPLEIANRVASAYFKRGCEYENESVASSPKQIEAFLASVRPVTDGTLLLVELTCGASPLAGASGIRIRQADSRPIGDSLDHFERQIGKLSLVDIESVKVLYRKKRVSLIPEASEDEQGAFVVRYSDHRLNARERIDFENLMRATHGLTVLSTEKRFKPVAR